MWTLISAAILATAAITGSIISAVENKHNREAQEKANEQNVEMQKETNEQSQYNMEHAHQIEMADLEAAGLNPVLTATGGNGAPLAQLQAPSVNPVKENLSGISSAINSAVSSFTMLTMATSMAKTNQALLAEREAGRNSRLMQVLAAKASNTHQANVATRTPNRASIKRAMKAISDKDLNWDFLEDPGKMPWE